ncbi:MAG: COR domain-containing protein, partial [Crocosphaera sp.]
SQLTSLKELYIFANQLSSLPPEISQLTSLAYLLINHNPLETPPIEVAKQGIEAIRDYFRQLEEEGYDTIYEAKLIIVGEAESGKTSLMNKILDPDYLVPQPEKSTHGIQIKVFKFPCPNNQDFRVNMWDFGGQAIYHQTHQFFLTKRSLYALVVDSRKEHDCLDYWLNIVEILSENSPMLIIKNEKDKCSVDLKNESQIRARFDKMVKDILTTDLAENTGLDKIIKAIEYHINYLPQVGIKIPKSWAKVRQAIEEDKRDYISLNNYLEICDRNQYPEATSFNDNDNNNKIKYARLRLSQFFHDLGIILHFQDNKASVLYDTVILNPEWGTQAVYELLKRENNPIKEKLGKFTFTDLEKIWSDNRYQGKHTELLELMKRFKLCYELPAQTYIAPQLLNPNPPKYDWNNENNLKLRYCYDFMPKGIISHFIVEMHPYIDEPNVWRSGVILTKDNTYGEVIETYNSREIQIKLVGSNTRGLLEIITAKLDEINNSYHRLKVDK